MIDVPIPSIHYMPLFMAYARLPCPFPVKIRATAKPGSNILCFLLSCSYGAHVRVFLFGF